MPLEDHSTDVGGLVEAARRAFGRLDVVVVNHARTSDQALEELSAEET